jgi:group I intron endonuclease
MSEEMFEEAYIYEIKIGKYFYHGQTTNMKIRLKNHFSSLKNNKHQNKKIQAVYNKYPDLFQMQVVLTLKKCNQEMINKCEQTFIDAWKGNKCQMNISMIAGKPPSSKGRKLSAEHIRKVAFANTGKKRSQEDKEKNKLSHLGKKHSEETKEKCRNIVLGIKRTPEEIEKSASKRRKALIINNIEYSSVKEASVFLNIKPSTIRYYLLNNRWPKGMTGRYK